ncbi:MAG: glycosyltransferase family 39 protein, partial [Ignavibacteria bacterium]|nr:glycosyltransferase family 39 protein [Ignavibacteria bacterium]
MKMILQNYLNFQYIPVLLIILIHIIALKFVEPINIDSKEYLAISKSIYEKNEYSVLDLRIKEFKNFSEESPTRMRQPLYPLFLVSTYWSFGGSIYLVLTIQLFINILSYLFIVKIAQLIFNKDLFIGSFLFVALYFPLWLLSAIIFTETLFTFLLIMAIYFLTYSIIRENNKYLFLSGLFLGLSFLTRPIGLSLIISFFIAL